MAHSVERLKIEFLKQMQAEERRVQEELQVLSAVLRRPSLPPHLIRSCAWARKCVWIILAWS